MKSASERAYRSNERAIHIRLRVIQEGISLADELFDFCEFLAAISKSCCFFDCPQFIRADGYARVGIPGISCPAITPP